MNQYFKPDERLLRWALAGFHITAFMLLFVLYLYKGGSLGSTLNEEEHQGASLIGLAAFAVLWAAIWYGTGKATAGGISLGGSLLSLSDSIGKGAIGGIITGAIAWVAILVIGVPATFIENLHSGVPSALVITLIGLVVIGGFGIFFAIAIGCFVGMVTSIIDFIILRAAFAFLGPFAPPEHRPNTELPTA